MRKPRKPLTISPALAAYWAGSASASVMADYAAGRVTVIVAKPAAKEAGR